MNKPIPKMAPPDQAQRDRALDTAQSILVEAPAGSGKTDLLTRRFLSLLSEVEDPGQIVAITFTKAAAAEMRHRILSELETASKSGTTVSGEFSMESLARRALDRSRALRWQLLDLPAQLRISTIDSFCREIAIREPLLSGFGSDLRVDERPYELYRRAARRTLEKIDANDTTVAAALDDLLLWRDNNWSELETQLVEMLQKRDAWMHDFVLDRDPDWDTLRERLETPFLNAVRDAILRLSAFLDQVPGARAEALHLACFACEQSNGALHQDLAELAEFPVGPFNDRETIEEAHGAYRCLADLVLKKNKNDRAFRQSVTRSNGFPPGPEKQRLFALISDLRSIDGLETTLGELEKLPSVRYTDDDWRIVRACFTLLRQAAAELQIVFAETGAVDFIEVAQLAQRVLRGEDNLPSDAAIDLADGIHHLLVDEFQDTSRRQHRLLASIAVAWPDTAGRSLFVVGDPMQSIYSFRDADAELFPRVRQFGLELPGGDSLAFEFVPLAANFRTQPALVQELNSTFDPVFAADDGSGIAFSPALPARDGTIDLFPRRVLHLKFMPRSGPSDSLDPAAQLAKQATRSERESVRAAQTDEIVELIRHYADSIARAQTQGEKFRVAVLGRTRKALEPIAMALREADLPFRAVDLEPLRDRPEVLDALALGRALLNPFDRVAWLGVLRAPWCGLTLAELYTLSGGDDAQLLECPIPQLIAERIELLPPETRPSAQRVLDTLSSVDAITAASPTSTFGTWLEQAWIRIGGLHCVNAQARANLDLLWRCLDKLHSGAQDFLGPALNLALETLTAIPDPEAGTDCGVQLMTIHKSKGLEFEVVIVPELHAPGAMTRSKLLAWLERGIPAPDASGQVTEFLVAPMQTKGAERSETKQWVDRISRARESQEMRRILYVAATRAREELHFFARPEYKRDASGPRLVDPINSLLATAWPAFAGQVRSRFEDWRSAQAKPRPSKPGTLESLAASAASNLSILPTPARPTRMRRLPPDVDLSRPSSIISPPTPASLPIGLGNEDRYRRHEGGIASRALGTAVHRLLEETARLRLTLDWNAVQAFLAEMQPRIAAQVRAAGIPQTEAHSIAARALKFAQQAACDPVGKWILSPHAGAASEAAWSGIVADTVRTIRVDRVFRAGLEPLSEAQDAWWIVDYKTAHPDGLDPLTALAELRALFAPQLEAYAAILRRRGGEALPMRAGLYYPRMSALDWWPVED
jgi:ATP-dependent exoDNAse (exonuclease V) beta subunit